MYAWCMSISAIAAISETGMDAAVRQLSAASLNIANVAAASDAGVSRAEAAFSESAGGGVRATTRVSAPRPGEVAASLVADAVNLMGAVYALRMNTVAIRVAHEVAGSELSLSA